MDAQLEPSGMTLTPYPTPAKLKPSFFSYLTSACLLFPDKVTHRNTGRPIKNNYSRG
jgi:hypothetical protein